MSKTLWSWVAALALMSGTASAQTVQSVLQAASKNMGADNLKCITYSGTSGYVGIVGQAHDIRDDWPKVEISNYSRTINFDAKSSFEDRTTRQGNFPRVGGGGIPLQADQRQSRIPSSTNPPGTWWATSRTRSRSQADVRQVDIWMSPHGFVKGAMAPGANPVLHHAL